MSSPQGHLLEVFSSYQGEGPYAGLKQVFVRLSGCHLRCVYCDTPESWERAGSWTTRGTARRNPVSVEDTLDAIRSFGPHPSVSITGGEPVIHAGAIDVFAFDVKLPSCPGVRVDADDVRRCLDLARGREAFVKIVVLKDTPPEDLTWAAGLVPEGMPLILQLATPVNAQTAPPDGETLARLRRACGREVAVMPQLHVLAGWK
jgi:7-carboxy-7-deazaguanine synthase